jgi:hypothetical protein
MRGVPSPVSCDLSPGDRHTWREATGPASSRSARPTVRYGGVRAAAGCGASARRAAARDDALSRKRKRARLPCHLRRESPSPLAATARHCPVRSRSPCSSRASFASLGLGRSAWRAEGAPLMIVKKILTALAWRPSDRPGAGLASATRGGRIAPRWCGWCCRRRSPTRRRQHGRCPIRGAGSDRSFPGSRDRRCLGLRSARNGPG